MKFNDDDDDSEGPTVDDLILDNNFWSDVIKVLKVGMPIMKLLFKCDNQSKELMGKVYYHMFSIGESIKELEQSVPWAKEAAEKHESRWEYLHSRMHAAGYALDPEYLYSGDGDSLDESTMTGLMEVIERLSLRTVIQSAADPQHAAKVLTLESEQVQEHASTCMTQFASFRAKEGILTKGMVMQSARTMAPSQWWGTYCSHMPELQAVARSVLSQPVSACAAERNWSVYGQIKTPARNRMQHAVADKRVYCHETLHYQDKLQSASHRMEVEPWSDSDDSADSDVGDDEEAIVASLVW